MRRNKCHKTKQITLPAIFIHLASHYYFPLPNLKFGQPFGYWQAAILIPERVDFSLFIAAPPHMLNCYQCVNDICRFNRKHCQHECSTK